MTDETPLVPGEPTPAPVADQTATPAGGGVAEATPAQTPVDAEALRKQFEQATADRERLEKDLNRYKSSTQSREAQLRKEAEQKQEALRTELENIKRSGMDEETRRKYDFEMSQQRIQDLQTELQRRDEEMATWRAAENAKAHFKSLGVPEDALILDGTFDDLLESGWGWVSEKVKSITSAPPVTAPPVPPTLPVAPKVDVSGANTPSVKPTWADIEKTYGSRETFWQLVESKRLPASMIPD